MPTIEQEDVSTDGRRLRGQRTQTKVLEALLELVAEGEMRPTAQAVSNRAGVSLRTVYHHFEDVEDVRRRALELQRGRYQAGFRTIDATLPVEERDRDVLPPSPPTLRGDHPDPTIDARR